MKTFGEFINEGVEYKYAMVNRPVGIGAIPKGHTRTEPRPNKGKPHYDMARHGIVVYDRPLSSDEIKSFELSQILTDSESDDLAIRVAKAYEKFAAKIIEKSKDDPSFWNEYADKKVRQLYSDYGRPPSIPDWESFKEKSLESLKKLVKS